MAMVTDGDNVERGSFDVDQGTGGALRAKVNFADRHPSISQTILSGIMWGGTVVLIILTIAFGVMNNYDFKVDGECPSGLQAFGHHSPVCVSKSLLDDYSTCVGGVHDSNQLMFATMEDELQSTPDLKDLHPYTAKLVAHVEQELKDAEEDGVTKTVVPVRRLITRDHLEAASRKLADSDLSHKTMLQMLASPWLLPVMFPALMLVATGWFLLLRYSSHCAMWTTVAFFVVVILYMAILVRSQTEIFIIVLVSGLSYIGFMAYNYQSINAGCNCLSTGLKALAESPASLMVIVGTCALMMMYTAMLVALLVFTSNVMSVTETTITSYSHNMHTVAGKFCTFTPMSSKMTPFFTIMFMLTSNFFSMATSYSIAFALGCWYFHGGEGPAQGVPERPILDGMKKALMTRNGTGVCTQAAVTITVVEYIEKKVKQKNPCNCCDPLWLIAMILYCTVKQCLESLAHFALVAVAIEGGPFFQTTKHAVDTIGPARAARFFVVDSSLNWLLKLQANTLATAYGIASLVLVDQVQELKIFSSLFSGLDHVNDAGGSEYMQWAVIGIIAAFFGLFRRPLMTATVLILVDIYIISPLQDDQGNSRNSKRVFDYINCCSAACLVGCIGSLTFLMFAQAAEGSLAGMLYCWSLDEALGIEPRTESHKNKRAEVHGLMDQVDAINPTASMQMQAMQQPMAQQQQYAPQPAVQQNLVSVVCPPGAAPGQVVAVPLADGRTVQVTIPQGVAPGMQFQFQV